MKPGIPEFEDLFSGTEPVVPFAHAMDLLPGTTILLTIGEEPLLVEQEVGDGKILVFWERLMVRILRMRSGIGPSGPICLSKCFTNEQQLR